MFARILAPIPLAIAVVVGATMAGPLITTAEAATPAARKEAVRQFKMSTGLVGGKMVYLDAQGKPNPVLRANVGDTVEITIGSGEGAEHDIVIPELKVQSNAFNASTGQCAGISDGNTPVRYFSRSSDAMTSKRPVGVRTSSRVCGAECNPIRTSSPSM